MQVKARETQIFLTLIVIFVFYTITIATSEPIPVKERTLSGNETTRKGKLLFQEYNCVSCHQIYGLGGYMGPDLTNSYSQKGEEVIRTFLTYGSSRMPNFNLTKEEIEALTEYLKLVDETGYYPVKKYELTWYGTVKNLEEGHEE